MSNETKWTPGPWAVDGTTVYALTDNCGRQVNRFFAQPQSCLQDHEASQDELRANAHLMSIAPEMYEVLRAFERATDLWLPHTVDEEHGGEAEALHDLRRKMLDALAKTRGES